MAWFSSLPVLIQAVIIVPGALYLLGLITILFDSSAASILDKMGCLFGPPALGSIVGGYLAAIVGCTFGLSYFLDPILAFVLGLPLGMFLFTVVFSRFFKLLGINF